jgi:Peptidase family S41
LNGSTDSTILRGEEIISVDKVPVMETFEKSKGLFGTDKANQNSKNFYAERYFARNSNILYGIKDSMLLELRNTKKDSIYFRKIQTELAKNSNKILAKRYKNINRKNLNFKIVDSLNHVAVMDVVSFSEKGNKLDFHQLKFNKLVKKNFKTIEDNNVKHLIVDFRFNGGGLLTNTKRITKYVANRPFVATDSVKLSRGGFKKIFPPYIITNYLIGRLVFKKQPDGTYLRTSKSPNLPSKKHHYSGEIYVLMDGGSYSATTLTIGLWKDMNRATFVGNTVGGANWGSFAGQWKDLKLKNSKFKVHIPLMKLVHGQPNKTNKTFFVEPDYFVEQSFEDFIRRKDSPMDFVLDLIKNK